MRFITLTFLTARVPERPCPGRPDARPGGAADIGLDFNHQAGAHDLRGRDMFCGAFLSLSATTPRNAAHGYDLPARQGHPRHLDGVRARTARSRRLSVAAALRFTSLRQFTSVKVSLPEAVVRRLGDGTPTLICQLPWRR